jgi:hypothetical protein
MKLPLGIKMNARELFKESLPLIEKFAPNIAAAITRPVSFAFGYILPILANAFDAHPTDITQISANIINDPDAQKKLEQIKHEHSDFLCTAIHSFDRLTSAEINIKVGWADPK